MIKEVLLITFATIGLMVASLFVAQSTRAEPYLIAANPLGSACSNLSDEDKAKSVACNKDLVPKDDEGKELNPLSAGSAGVLYRITLIISAVAGAIAVIMIIVAGIGMITSSGDSQKNANNRNTIIFAIVGLIVIVLAQALVGFIINRFVV